VSGAGFPYNRGAMEETAGENPFAFGLYPLRERTARWCYVTLYVFGSLVWANLPPEAARELREHLGVLAIFLLPAALVVFRMLSRLLSSGRFAAAIVAALVLVTAGSAVVLPAEAAVARVYETFPFVALGATLAGSLLACILSRPFSWRGLPALALHAGLVVAIAGAFVSLLFRENGYVRLEPGESASSALRRDYVLTLRREGGGTLRLRLPFEGTGREDSRTYTAGSGEVRLRAQYRRGARGRRLTIFASDRTASDTAELAYGGAPGTLEIGGERYMVDFGPSQLRLPFTLTLEEAWAEYYGQSRIPKEYRARVRITSTAGAAETALLRVNEPASRAGWDILLNSVSSSGAVVLEAARDPGAPVLFAGALVAAGALLFSLALKIKAGGRAAP